MKAHTRRIQFKGVVETRDVATSLIHSPGDVVLIERSRPRFMVMRCPCGCGDNLFANLDRRAGPAWRFYRRRGQLTLFPSYWREDACESHFIIWNDRIFWCDRWDDDDFWSVEDAIEETVLKALPKNHFVKYSDLAEEIDLIPWEVLQACRQLQSRELAVGDKGSRSIAFRRSGSL
jgi:hypothetical protein